MSRPTLRNVIVVLTLATAAIHLYLNFNAGKFVPQPAFIANFIGYIALLVAFFKWVNLPFLKGREKPLWYAFMGYAALTIVAYFAVNGAKSFSNPIGLADKAIEVLLIVALWLHKEN
ncbi:MAG: hypothetical protein HYZ49_09025 [Chloroflexi bacterium]|nr:hypothetical protein [Chloroflexota bacterium]